MARQLAALFVLFALTIAIQPDRQVAAPRVIEVAGLMDGSGVIVPPDVHDPMAVTPPETRDPMARPPAAIEALIAPFVTLFRTL